MQIGIANDIDGIVGEGGGDSSATYVWSPRLPEQAFQCGDALALACHIHCAGIDFAAVLT